ncbi:TonB-dependent receptor [Pontibacter sp. SGAir0037]|uniref:SusC/RagA family TonB-linked outer membrane protein n=1 Tax=Pontibacter sp. SGAir0037 TaxID=2571030 RepID=UPI0010CCC349|nr:TonB-dependent receptor [Pontibacter sp. SGAir0037]QCR22252.1 SusC/RagA family protein [Pontibacter sp. SGAir0037]
MKKIVLLFFCLLTIQLLHAQNTITVQGKVTDATNGQPLIGAGVLIKGTGQGAQTNLEGNYTLTNVPSDAVLVINYIGYEPKEVPVNNQTTLNVQLGASAAALEEVVVIGYGTASRRDLTGSISTVRGSEVADRPSTNPIASIQGKVAGVQIVNNGRPGEQPDVRIRGTNSINSVQPLYVVDGILNDNINFLNPADIESMEVLKDPSSLAIFGVRGANGVIIITTKRAKEGQLQVNFNSTIGFKNVVDRISLTNAAQFQELYNEQLMNQGSAPYNYSNWQGDTDWQDQIFQRGVLNYNNVSITGATEKNRFYMGLGYMTEEGVIKHEKLEKITLNLNDELKVSDALKFGFSLNGSKSKLPQTRDVGGAILAAPIAEPYNEEWGLYSTLPDFQRAQVWNPLVDVELRKNTNLRNEYRLVGNIFGEVNFLKNFNFRAAFLADYGFNQGRSYSPLIRVYNPDIVNADPVELLVQSTSVNQNQNIYTKIQSDYLLTYKNTFGEHNLTLLGGFTTYYNSYESINAAYNQPPTSDPVPNDPRFFYVGIGDAANRTAGSDQWERVTASYLFRALYNYQNKYLLNTSFRRDGSSGFRVDFGQTWQNFFAVGGAWVVSEESFMRNQTFLDYLKVKGSWGVLGNQNTGGSAYPAYPVLTNANSGVFGNNVIPALEPEYIVDPNLRWESVRSWEAGVELATLANRLSFEGVYYDKRTDDIITQVPGISGTKPGLRNQGSVANHGIELAASWNDKIGNDWSYSISGNLTTINNNVLSLANTGYRIVQDPSRTEAGYPIGYFYGYISDGIYQTNEEIIQSPVNTLHEVKPGDIKYRDVNGDGIIDENDRTMIGNPTPDFTYGASVSIGYKGFDLSADFMGVYGNEIFRNFGRSTFAQFNYPTYRMDRWNGIGTSNWEPILHTGRANNYMVSNYYIEDGSFFRIRNLQLGYNFNADLLKAIRLKTLRVYLNAQNPLTFKRTTGYTPEFGGSATSFGVDNGSYPIPAIYTAGINVNF